MSWKCRQIIIFVKLIRLVGIPEESAKVASSVKCKLEIKIDGNDITFTNITPENNNRHSTNLVLNKEVDEIIANNILIKVTNFHKLEIDIFSRNL